MSTEDGHWTRHFVYRSERLRTTWKFRFGAMAILVLGLWLTSRWWTAAVARSLVCDSDLAPSDAILVENFDPAYQLFEKARTLRENGLAARVLVPVPVDSGTAVSQPVALATTEMLARLARLGTFEVVPVHEVEPISLNAAVDIRNYVHRQNIHSVLVVTPLFRSRRSSMVYRTALNKDKIIVRCAPTTDGERAVDTWTRTWHGIEDVGEQWAKLQYYRFWIVPFYSI